MHIGRSMQNHLMGKEMGMKNCAQFMWVSDCHSSHRTKYYPRHTAHGLACREVIETSTFSKI